jgi:hypothetical protein
LPWNRAFLLAFFNILAFSRVFAPVVDFGLNTPS